MTYDRTDLPTGDIVTATVVANNTGQTAPMVMLDLPIPAGFEIESEDLDRFVSSGRIARYELTARSATLYLRSLAPDRPLELGYRLRATMPVKVQIPPAVAYEYYDPDKRATSEPARLTVASGE